MQGSNATETQQLVNEKLNELYRDVIQQRANPREIQQKILDDINYILERAQAPKQLTISNLLLPGQITLQAFLEQMELNIFAEGLKQLQAKHQFQLVLPQKSKEKRRHGREDFVGAIGVEPYAFKQEGDTLISKTGAIFKITKKLEGRGQSGMANFYSDGNNQFLIKEDDAGTCIMEATAYFVRDAKLLPPALENSTNFATVGVMMTESSETKVLSVQPRVMPSDQAGKVMPWDVMVYGAKREPQTLMSWEGWYPGKVFRGIAELDSIPQWQLAAGIFTSQVAGDESLHIGQFMADVDAENNIVGITRIDLGARERYAVSRDVTWDASPYVTSQQYQSVGQYAKDYCGAMLKNPQLNQKVTLLWARLDAQGDTALRKSISASSKAAFLKQFSGLPEEKKREALIAVLKTINNPSKIGGSTFTPIEPTGDTLDEKIESVATAIGILDAERAVRMKNNAVKKFKDDIQAFNEEYTKYMPESDERFKDITALKEQMLLGKVDKEKLQELLSSLDNDIKELVKRTSSKPDDMVSYHKIHLMSQASVELLEMLQLNEMNQPTGINLKDLNDSIKKYQSFVDCAEYCLRDTATTHKRLQVNTLMKEAEKGTLKDYLLNNPGVAEALSTHTSTVGSLQNRVKKTKTQGEYLARKLFKRYGLDLTYLTLTPTQRLILEQAEKQQFRDLKNTVESTAIENILAPDSEGRTSLHYLMENLKADDKDAMDALVFILQKSLGATYNSNLDIPDREGKTPLHILLENRDAERIIKGINSRKIKNPNVSSWLAYPYMVEDFFKDTTQYTKGERELVKDVQEGKRKIVNK